jgi:hypothetical protein
MIKSHVPNFISNVSIPKIGYTLGSTLIQGTWAPRPNIEPELENWLLQHEGVTS